MFVSVAQNSVVPFRSVPFVARSVSFKSAQSACPRCFPSVARLCLVFPTGILCDVVFFCYVLYFPLLQ
jgi:hypothetical protein